MHQEITIGAAASRPHSTADTSIWRLSWPSITAAYAFLFTLYEGHIRDLLLLDGDTYWHVATGRWIWNNGFVPTQDPFSQTMHGAPWTASSWLSEVVLARVHDLSGWDGVVALTGVAFAIAIAILTRALLQNLEPTRAVLLTTVAIFMTAEHLLARPHILVLPLLMVWMVGLVQARDSEARPSYWLLVAMLIWANMHASFTLGIALAFAFGLETLLRDWSRKGLLVAARTWGPFLTLSLLCAAFTPHGINGYRFTWQVLMESSHSLGRIGEFASANFHRLQPLEAWLLGGLAVVLHQGLRLPPIRLILVLGFLHLALKHVRYIEFLGLLVPLVIAAPFARQWLENEQRPTPISGLDRFSRSLALPAGHGGIVVLVFFLAMSSLFLSRLKPVQPPAFAAPVKAIRAVQDAGVKGTVLNGYGWGGYLIYAGIRPFIDGRADMYGEKFMKEYTDALDLRTSDGLENLLAKYQVAWTLLPPHEPAVALMDHLPAWKRLYADNTAVVHVRIRPEATPSLPATGKQTGS